MKIAIVSTYDNHGGAAIASKRLLKAFESTNHEVSLLVLYKSTNNENVVQVKSKFFNDFIRFIRFVIERLFFLFCEKDKSVRFAFSPAITGYDLSSHPLIMNSDVINLHWINHGFLSLNGIKKIIKSNKPIVWTLHDMWFFTGGCHYCGDCFNFRSNCGQCPYLRNPHESDLSNRILERKYTFLSDSNLEIVTCSEWLKKTALLSPLLKTINISAIPNPIDINFYRPRLEQRHSGKKFTILFQAMNINDKRKGLIYLIEALQYIKVNDITLFQKLHLILFGKGIIPEIIELNISYEHLGFISDETKMIETYNKADIFVMPSLEDNLPNSIMESMACGTPVVAFDIGGIPEMVDHLKNGYLAISKNIKDFASGIKIALERSSDFGIEARKKAVEHYNNDRVTKMYLQIYHKSIKSNNPL